MMREFGKKSYEHQNSNFCVLALFSRRPKITMDPLSGIYVTINPELRYFERFMRARGVPAIAGCPMVRVIWDLSGEPKVSWIDMAHNSLSECFNRIDCEEVPGALLTEHNILKRVSESEVISLDGLGDAVRLCRCISGLFKRASAMSRANTNRIVSVYTILLYVPIVDWVWQLQKSIYNAEAYPSFIRCALRSWQCLLYSSSDPARTLRSVLFIL